jgi:hypothetical protein
MRAQLRTHTEHSLAFWPVVHNISGQLVMDRAMRCEYVNGSGKVCRKKNFGSTRCLYSVCGNVLFRPDKTDMVFKGVRNVAALCNTLQRATDGMLVHIRVSMLVMTIQLQKNFSVCEQCPLERALVSVCSATAVCMLPRTEEESNALIFRIRRWAVFLPGRHTLATEMDTLGCIMSISRQGICTMRVSSPVRGSVATWLNTQQSVHQALCLFASFTVALPL